MPVQVTISVRTAAKMLVAAIILALAAYGVVALARNPLGGAIDPERLQAVVLSSGAVYFGHLRTAGSDFYELRDAFFVQETQGEGEQIARRVVPLGEELHGPEDRMLIPRAHVVIIENLRPDSPVTRAAEQAAE